MDTIENKFSKRTIILIILIIIGLLSRFIVTKIVTAPEFNATTIASLDDKKVTVLKLAGTAAAASTAITLIPGDAAMPIADQIAELTPYFIVILGAILLEKMLVGVVGYISFAYIIPFACILGIAYLYSRKEVLGSLAIKLAIFGVIIFTAIPVSIKVSDVIYESYKGSIEQTLETANQNKDYIEEKKQDIYEEDKKWVEKIGDYLSNLTSNIGNSINDMVKKGEDTLSAFLDAIAILIITSCFIPIVILLIFAWILKILFGFDAGGLATIFQSKIKAHKSKDRG